MDSLTDKTLRERCHVNNNTGNDNFVGIRADTGDVSVCFPVAYQLPEDDAMLREDIRNLLSILESCMKEEKLIENPECGENQPGRFPLKAYLNIIRNYLENGKYYVETVTQYKTDTRGPTNWPKTFKDQTPLIQRNGNLVFNKRTVRSTIPTEREMITQIHKYCVYEAFEKLGWVYTAAVPYDLGQFPGFETAIGVLRKKIASTQNEENKHLFNAMIEMLLYEGRHSHDRQYSFGTYRFEYVWEHMVDVAFGIEGKSVYLPQTQWNLDYGWQKRKTALQPDSIMVHNDKFYVLDSKYYRYGWSGNLNDLPNGPDINKQITYGEFIERSQGISNDNLYNAFIMPFNKKDNLFFNVGDDVKNIINIGEAVGNWRANSKNYERIQGILIDIRYLMLHYTDRSKSLKDELAHHIEHAIIPRDV